jgi:hypothetical protein
MSRTNNLEIAAIAVLKLRIYTWMQYNEAPLNSAAGKVREGITIFSWSNNAAMPTLGASLLTYSPGRRSAYGKDCSRQRRYAIASDGELMAILAAKATL